MPRASVAATACRAALKLAIAGCLGLFMWIVWGWVTDAFYVQLAPIFNNWGLHYTYSGSLGVNSLDAYDTGMVALLWLPVLAAALAALVLQAIPRGSVPRAYTAARRRMSRLLAWQAPPRRFWSWWCGGMTVKDSVVLLFTIAFNLWYFIYYYQRYDQQLDATAAAGVAFPEPRWRLMLERVALICGIMMWPNLWLLFFPIPQSNFLQGLTGLQYAEMIRYHRWLGQITLVVLSLHGWLYYLYWAIKQEFWYNFSNWGTISSINFLAGTVSYVFALVLWSTSLAWVRRRAFEVFYRCHIVCFLGFTLFAYMHYYWSWSYFLPGLLLYAADLALRAGQLSGTTLVAAAAVDEAAGVATLQFKTAQPVSKCPVHELFLMVPSISRWQWHPITVAGAEPDPAGPGSLLTLSVKRYGRWTRQLLERLHQPQPLAVRVSAPSGPNVCDWRGCHTVVLLGGGIGATPLLAAAREMMAARAADPKTAGEQPARVRFLWATREPREFCVLDPALLAAASASDGWLSLGLFCTGVLPLSGGKDSPGAAGSMDTPRSLGSESGLKPGESGSVSSREGEAAPDAATALASPFLHRAARAVQPQAVNGLHLAVVYVLTWLGAFLALVLGGAYLGEAYTYYGSYAIPDVSYALYWKVGTVWFFTQAVMAVALPYALAVLPVHVWRYWRATRQPGCPELLPLAPPARPTGHGAGCRLAGATLTADGEAGVEITAGRPVLRDALLAAGEGLGPSDTVGVFVGGPEPLVRQAQLECASLNGWRQPGPHYAFRAVTHSL